MFRYLFCAIVSVLLHFFLWSQPIAKPITINVKKNLNTTIQLRLMSAAQVPKVQDVPTQRVEKIQPKPLIKKKMVKKVVKKTMPKKSLVATTPKKIVKTINKKPVQKEQTQPAMNIKKENLAEVAKENANARNVAQASNIPVLMEKPRFKFRPTPPEYPRTAKRRGQQGTVIVEIWLSEKGEQLKQLVVKSSNYDILDKAALRAVKQWQFQGHQINGKSVASRLKVPVKFELN